MQTLPTTEFPRSDNIQLVSYPSRTFYIDPVTRRVTGVVDGHLAMKQAIEIALNIQRFYWQIYSPAYGTDWDGLIGNDAGFVAAELLRRVTDSLSSDDRVIGISDYHYTVTNANLVADFIVRTVYGDIPQSLEVRLT